MIVSDGPPFGFADTVWAGYVGGWPDPFADTDMKGLLSTSVKKR
jgi:hypothetical protein